MFNNKINQQISIRIAKKSDASALSTLILNNASNTLKPHYNEQQWIAFNNYYAVKKIEEKIIEQIVFCAIFDKNIIGTIALDKDFVVGFYTKIDFLKMGVGKILSSHLEQFALSKGIKTLQLSASPEGLSFYLKNGWTKIKNIIFEYESVGFEETLMEKKIF